MRRGLEECTAILYPSPFLKLPDSSLDPVDSCTMLNDCYHVREEETGPAGNRVHNGGGVSPDG